MIHTPKPSDSKKQTELDADMASTIAEARDKVKKMEVIKKAPKEEAKPLTPPLAPKKVEKKVEGYTMSPTMITAVVILITAMLGGYGVMFFRYTDQTTDDIKQLQIRLGQLEQKLKK